MRLNIDWKKTMLITFDIFIMVYLVMAVTAWHNPTRKALACTKVNINIADDEENGFLNPAEVKRLLEKNGLYPLSEPIKNIDPRDIENRLAKMPFVNTAQCYVTKEGHVCITITQRTPIVRVKSATGDDYYVDDNGGVMPNSQYTSNMIIATGSITRAYACNYLSVMTQCIMDDDLWRNEVEQINILPDRTVELIPRIGDHIINIGAIPMSSDKKDRDSKVYEYVANQLKRLEEFYKYGLSQAGWNKYSYISLEYSNQIVCRKKGESETANVQQASVQ